MKLISRQKNLLTVLVLAGGDLKSKTLGPSKPIWSHPLMLPAGSCLAIEIIRRFYEKGPLPCEFKIAIDSMPPNAAPIRSLEQKDLILIEPHANIIGSLQASLKEIKTPWVLVNPITTLPARPAELACQIMVGEEKMIREDWSSLKNEIKDSWAIEKKTDVQTMRPSSPFTGILCAPTEILSKLASSIPSNQSDDLISLAEALMTQNKPSIIKTQWHDLAHLATHAAGRRSNYSSRDFNKVQYCRRRDVIVKSSSDRARLEAERNYLETLPEQLRRHFPALIPIQNGEIS